MLGCGAKSKKDQFLFNSVLITPRFEGKGGQVILRHTELTAYRCFLPDLAGFTGFYCTGPSPLPRSYK